MFAGLDEPQLERLAQASQDRVIPKGSVIFLQGDAADSLYIVRSGLVTSLFSNPDGRELVVGEMRAGHYFGELALLTNKPRSMSLVAREKSELILIPHTIFTTFLNQEPILARNLLFALAERLYRSAERERALAFMDAPARLAQLLLQLNEAASEVGYITVSQDDLARRTGLTRQTVAKSLGRWRRLGWLLTGRGKIVLLNFDALREAERQ